MTISDSLICMIKKENFQRHTYLPKEIYDVKNVTHEDLKIARELKKTPTAAKTCYWIQACINSYERWNIFYIKCRK